MKLLGLSFLAGLVGALGFAPVGLWPFTVLAFAGLMTLIARAPTLRSALARGWWFGVGQFVLGLNWIATAFTFQAAMPAWLGWVAVVLLSLYLAVYPAAAAGLAWRWGRDKPAVLTLVFAAAWIVTEWLRASLFTGFAWNPVGVALIDTPLASAATAIGTYGLSGLMVLLAGAASLLLLRRWLEGGLLLGALAIRAAWSMAGPAALPVGSDGAALRIVQPNISQADKWRPGFHEEGLRRLGRLSRTRTPGPRLLIWPEAAVTEPLQDERRQPLAQRGVALTRLEVRSLLRPDDLLLAGGITIQSEDGRRASGATNSVFAIDGRGRILARYDKAHLVPYGEYLPMRPLLSAIGLSRLAPGNLDFEAGPGAQTLRLPLAGRVGFQLCYEIIFSGEVVQDGNRPSFLFNPSNDAWFGAWGPPQHLAQARLRALEEGLPVLRATPTGISAVIDADGRLLHSIPLGRAGVIDARLPPARAPTLFARFGNVLPLIFALLLAGAAVALRRKGG